MDNVISLSGYAAQKEQDKRDAEDAEYESLRKMVAEIIESNPPDMSPFFAYSETDIQASTIDTAVMKLMDAITLLDQLGMKKESLIIDKVVADILGIETE